MAQCRFVHQVRCNFQQAKQSSVLGHGHGMVRANFCLDCGSGAREWHVAASARAAITQLDQTSRQIPADNNDGWYTQQLGVGELHAGRHAPPVVKQDAYAASVEIDRERLGGLELISASRREQVHIRGATSRGQHNPLWSRVCSASAATARLMPMP